MSLPYSIQANSRTYTVVDDITSVYSAVITGLVTDEVLGDFLSAGFTVKASRPDLNSKTIENGLYAIAGHPDLVFPKLSSQSYTVGLAFEAPGFQEKSLLVTVPQNTTFPVSAATVALRRLPVRLQGRVVQDLSGQPISGALIVAVDNPHPSPPPPPPPPIPHTILLRSPLYFSHPVNTQVRQVTLTTVGSAQLLQPARAGDRVLHLTGTAGLGGAAFVRFASPDLTLVEYGVVSQVGPPAGQVLLVNALNRSYGTGTATKITFVTAALGAGITTLLADADAQDGILLAKQLLSVNTVVVDPASPTALEYHEIGALTDSRGYYAADGIGRAAELFLQANPPGTPVVPWFVEYDQPVNVLNFRL